MKHISSVPLSILGVLALLVPIHPTVGDDQTLRQQALELRNSLVVLTISLQPGDEDFRLIEDLRYNRGARVTSAYVTNGESGESDFGSVYPHHLAAIRREEATQALGVMHVSEHFMNVPSAGSTRDTSWIWKAWNKDSLQLTLMRLITAQRPHLIVLFPERYTDSPSLAWEILKDNLTTAIRRLQQPKTMSELRRMAGLAAWEVQRCISGTKGSATSLQKGSKASRRVRSAEEQYRSLSRKRAQMAPAYEVEYSEVLYPPRSRKPQSVHAGLPQRVPPLLRSLHRKIDVLTKRILNARTISASLRQRSIDEITLIADSVDYLVGVKYGSLRGPEQKTLTVWKQGLQDLKNELGGISVFYTLEDTVLTFVQVTTLTVDSIHGADPGGKLWLFFPPVKDGWIINESRDQRLPLEPGDQFRIVTPSSVPFNLPASDLGLQQENTRSFVDCFVVQTHSNRLNNQAVHIRLPFRFAPRFTAEVMTPLVRAIDGERVAIRLVNYSRDGVRDHVGIADSIATSTRAPFWLVGKESEMLDTVVLTMNRNVTPGDYVLPVDISGIEVARVGLRAFEAMVDTTIRVGLVSGTGMSAAHESLRRLGLSSERRTPADVTGTWLSTRTVVILDHRLSTIEEVDARFDGMIRSYADSGGRVVVLSQDAVPWNENPLATGLTLSSSSSLGPDVGVQWEEVFGTVPNAIRPEDWDFWLFARAPNVAVVDEGWKVLARTQDPESVLIASKQIGRGKITYVNLSLPPQWLNIHAGAFRLLANLLSY